ncbi:MAG: hypothetical protein OEW60_03895, partial [Thiovulaceae bacterium]|nr:hypothetical protein [Sulfurimonadaceae bacterium]
MSKFHNIVLLIILSITSTVYADKSYDIFIEGCHLNNPISNQNNWHGIYKYNLNGKISYKLLKVKLSTSKKIDKIDGLIDFCVKSNQIKDAEKVQKNSGVLIKSSFLEEKFIEAAHLTKFSFNELSKIGRDYDRNFPRTEESIKIKLGDLEYILNQTTNLNDNAVGPNHTLTLSHNNISQVLFNKHGNYEGVT